jgi:two-component system, NarL family, response regulator NreC
MSKLRIVLADDHALLRAGLAVLINAQDDMAVVAQASTTAEAIAVAASIQPDVLVLDLTMPDGSSVKAIETIQLACAQTKILVLTMHDDPAYLRSTLTAGAAGYLVKTASDAELLSALRTVAQGRTAINLSLSPDELQKVLGAAGGNAAESGGAALSEREQEVLALLARGHTNQQIADKLFLSVKTIETYRSRIGEKLGLRDRAQLVAHAIKSGMLDTNEIT